MKSITLNGTKLPLPQEIPYSETITGGLKAIERQQARKAFEEETKEIKRLTRIRNGKPTLLNGVGQQLAIEKLFLYEETGKTPYEIHIMQERIENLEKRIIQLESYD